MSQGGILQDKTTALADIETLTADSGGAVGPNGVGNVDFVGGTNLTTVGVPGSNSITINQDNVEFGTAQTIGAVTADIITVACGATPGSYQVQSQVSAFESSTPAGGGFRLVNGVRTTGAASILTGTTDNTINREVAIAASNADIVVSGNNIIVRVTGVIGLTMQWTAKLQYVFAS